MFFWGLFHGLILVVTRHWVFLSRPNLFGKVVIYIFGLSFPLIALFVSDPQEYLIVVTSIFKGTTGSWNQILESLITIFSAGRIPLVLILALAVVTGVANTIKLHQLHLRLYRSFSCRPLFVRLLFIYIVAIVLFSLAEISESPYLYLRY